MDPSPTGARQAERTLLGMGLAALVLALVVNEWSVARLLSGDGTLEASTRAAVRVGQALLAVGAALVIRMRARLAPRLEAWRPFEDGRITLRHLLVAAMVLRLLVFVWLFPTNNDPHWDYVRFIAENGRVPISDEFYLAFQAPLYYVLASPLGLTGSLKLTQALSLLFSLANLLLLHRLVARTPLLRTQAGRCHAMLLAGFLPQFVLFSSFISNDALAYPLGTLVLLSALHYVESPTRRNVLLLGAVQGLALLTKGTLIANLPVLALVVLIVEGKKREPIGRRLSTMALFGALVVLLGCFKFVQNAVHFGTPVVGNDVLGYEWVHDQAGVYQGPASLVDVNVLELVREPYPAESNMHSVPLMLYGSFWGRFIDDSNFDATWNHPWRLVQRALMLAGVVPTLLIGLGLASELLRARSLLRLVPAPADAENDRALRLPLSRLVVVLTLAGAVALVVKWGLQHDAWSFFQSRLFFTAFPAIALTYAFGWERIATRGPALRWSVGLALLACYALFGAYFAIELGTQALGG